MKTIDKQVKHYGPRRMSSGDVITAEVRHDDSCKNGHNSFGITATIYGRELIRGERSIQFEGKPFWPYAGGCCHDEVVEAFPELAPLIQWHLCSTDGPMHYIENAKYWAGLSGYCDGKPNSPPNERHLKSTIVYGALPDDSGVDPMALAKEGRLVEWLNARTEKLLAAFRAAVEGAGMTFGGVL